MVFTKYLNNRWYGTSPLALLIGWIVMFGADAVDLYVLVNRLGLVRYRGSRPNHKPMLPFPLLTHSGRFPFRYYTDLEYLSSKSMVTAKRNWAAK